MFLDRFYKTKGFIRDRYIFGALVAGVVLWAIAFGIAYVNLFPLEKNLILHINFQKEVDAVGTTWDVLWILLGIAVLFIMDQAIALSLYFREKILSYLVSYAGTFIVFLGMAVIYYLTLAN